MQKITLSKVLLAMWLVFVLNYTTGLAAELELPEFARTEGIRKRTDVKLLNGGFEGRDGWVQADMSPFISVDDCYSGRKACRLNGGMVKTELLPLAPGEELFFLAHTKVDNLRVIEAELAFFDENANWLQEGSGPLARGDQYSWQKITGHFLNSKTNVKYVTLQFYGTGVLDEVQVWKEGAPADNGDRAKISLDTTLSAENSNTQIYLANDKFAAWISRQSGLLTSLVSLQPVPKVIQPAGKNSMQVYVRTTDGTLDADFDRLQVMEQPYDKTIVCCLSSSNPELDDLAQALVTYTFGDERLDIHVEINFKKDDNRNFQYGLRNVFQDTTWNRCIYPSFPVSETPAATAVRASFYYAPGDNTVKTIGCQLPYAFLESSDRILAWGSLDLGNFSVLTPNDIPCRLPSMQLSSNGVKAGLCRRFNSFYAVFPKDVNELTQAMKYCVDNLYSSHPLMHDLMENRDREIRYFTRGAFAWYHPGAVPPGCDGWRQDMLDRYAQNVWYSWWSNWNEECFTDGDWYTYDCRHLSADIVKDEIEYMQDMGLNVYLYFRQFLAENGTYEDHPPYKKWLARDESGHRQAFIDYPVPFPNMLGGVDKVYWTMADFGQADCRDWYVEMAKKCIDFYRPTGLAWDMGFWTGYSSGEPEVGIGNGTLWIQAVMYDYLKDNYPDMRIATNESFCSPSALFGDCILIEGAWRVGKKSNLDYQLAKGFGKTIFSLQLMDDYLIQLMPYFDTSAYTHLEIRGRSEGLLEAVIAGADVMKDGLRPDGSWQTVRVPYNLKGIRAVDIGIRTGDHDGGYLEFSQINLVAPANPDLPPLQIFNENSKAEDFTTSRKWYHREPGLGRVEKTEEGLRISLDGVNKAYDTFSVGTVRQEICDINLKVLALGAICSDAQIPALKELNSFSAELAAMRHLSERKLIYNAPAGVYGTFWSRDDRTAGAIYNESGSYQKLELTLDRLSFPDGGAGLENGQVKLQIVDRQGNVMQAAGWELSAQDDSFLLVGELEAGHLLLISNWN